MSNFKTTKGRFPLTLPQLDFWEEFILHPDEPLSTVAHYIELKGAVNEAALLQAVERTAKEAEVLAIRFVTDGSTQEPQQYIDPSAVPQVTLVDLRHRPNGLSDALELMNEDVGARLDIRNAPLSKQILFRINEDRYLWYIRSHHIVVDGYGIALIEQRCGQLYNHYCGLSDEGVNFHPFSSFIQEEETYQKSVRFKRDQTFWSDHLSEHVKLPVLAKDCEDYGGGGRHAAPALNSHFVGKLHALSAEVDVGWPDLLVLLSGLYLQRVLPREHQNTLLLWLPFMSRWGSVAAHMPAMVVNILPFHLTVEADDTVLAFLKRNASQLRQRRRHGRYRIEQIAADQKLASKSRFFFSPLINVLPFDVPRFAALDVIRHVLANGPGDGFNLTFREEAQGDRLSLQIDADATLTNQQDFTRISNELPQFLNAIVQHDALASKLNEAYGLVAAA